jgi:hypothetical protein
MLRPLGTKGKRKSYLIGALIEVVSDFDSYNIEVPVIEKKLRTSVI